MKRWSAPELPKLPDAGRIPWLYDTATGELQPSAVAPTGRLYVCGITPYDATHIGHAATYVTFDLLVRAWRDAGLTVRYAQNVTDVDDPLLERARETGENWADLAERETMRYVGDMAALRVVPPDDFEGVAEAMPRVIALIERLRQGGVTYEVEGDLYFRVDAAPRFGAISGLSRTGMLPLFAERGGDPYREGKQDPLDGLLWLAERPGEPAWDSPFGRGRPGWHVECAAIAVDHLGMCIDVQGGGSDLVFPHHEFCAAQAEAVASTVGATAAESITGQAEPFARLYVHQGMIGLNGEKMSKSRGNLVFVSQLREEGTDPMAVRLALLEHHYREDWEWSPGGLLAAQERLDLWRGATGSSTGPGIDAVLNDVRTALVDDLDTPSALSAVDRWCASALAGSGGDPAAPGQVKDLCSALLGVEL